ncbi:MAG: cell division FtsA domain-containing protein [Patescibacteria group bacterium]
MSLFNSSKKPARFLTVDIGSNLVKCMVFEVDPEQNSKIVNVIGEGAESLPMGATRGGVIVHPEEVEDALKMALNKATEDLDHKVKDVIFGVSGDLALGLMTTVKIVRGKNDAVSEKELNKVYDKIYQASLDEASTQLYEYTGNSDVDLEIVTSSMVYTKLDEKLVSNPVGMEASKMEIAFYACFCPSFHIQSLQNLAKALGLNIIAIGSQMYAAAKALQLSSSEVLDCALMDIGGEQTDVAIVFGGGIVATRSLPIGGNHFTSEISKKMNIPFADAEKVKQEYSFGNLSESENMVLQDSIVPIMETWLSGVELLFTEFTGVKTFASKIFLIGGGAELPDIEEFIAKEPWTRSIPFKSPPEFSKLSLADLSHIVDKTGSLQSMSDLLPASLSIIYLELNGFLDER